MSRNEINLGGASASDDLEAMLAGLDAAHMGDEIVEPVSEDSTDSIIEPGLSVVAADDDLEAMLTGVDAVESIEPVETVAVEPEPPKKAAKLTPEEKAAKKKAEQEARAAARDAKKAEREAKKAEKPAPTPRKHYTSKVERITDKLGDKVGDYTVLTLSDAALTGDDLAAKQQETLAMVKNAGVKVQNRMTMILEFVAGKSSKLNEVIERAFKLLNSEGKLTVGEKGNFHQNLLAKPYSPAAARAMGNNTLAAMREFKVIAKNAEGEYVANPESLILMKTNQLLGLK